MNNFKKTKLLTVLSAVIIMLSFCGCKKNADTIIAAPEEFINYTINGTPYSFVPPNDSIRLVDNGPLLLSLRVSGHRIPGSTDSIAFTFDRIGISSGTIHHFFGFSVSQIPFNSTINAPIFLQMTELGPTGEYLAANFSGSYTGPAPTNTVYNVTCNFRIKRNF